MHSDDLTVPLSEVDLYAKRVLLVGLIQGC